MKLFSFFLAALFAAPGLAAASDPFVGTWVYNADRSPKPTITYGIKDLGGDRYALTGSSGETTQIKADGVAIKSPSGATVSFKKLDDHTWQMERVDSRTMKRTYTVSADDKRLQLVDVFTATDGGKETTTTVYARTSPGKSLYGEWKSVSLEDKVSGPPEKLIIEPYGKDGLSLISTSNKRRTDMQFDGKQYFEIAPDGTKGDSASGRRINDHVIQMQGQVNGKPDSINEFKVSDDGKTLTLVSKSIKTSTTFTSVWDKE
jgi:hypothetical protein